MNWSFRWRILSTLNLSKDPFLGQPGILTGIHLEFILTFCPSTQRDMDLWEWMTVTVWAKGLADGDTMKTLLLKGDPWGALERATDAQTVIRDLEWAPPRAVMLRWAHGKLRLGRMLKNGQVLGGMQRCFALSNCSMVLTTLSDSRLLHFQFYRFESQCL